MDLTDKHVVITGTSSGIGRALAQALLRRGARLTTLERRPQETGDDRWQSLAADITKGGDLQRAAQEIAAPVDVLINNAGVMRRGGVLQSAEDDFDALMDTNVKGSWLTLKHLQPLLGDHAMIVQMCSRHAISLPEDPALYGLSKRFVMDLAEVVAKSHPQYTVKVLCPGPVDTPLARVNVTDEQFTEKQKMMCSPEELAEQVVALLESDRKMRLVFDTHTYTHFLE